METMATTSESAEEPTAEACKVLLLPLLTSFGIYALLIAGCNSNSNLCLQV